jgi:presenilin-like A22 family membrane protease
MSPRARILFFTTILYAVTLALGVAAASRLALAPGGPALPHLELNVSDAAIFLAVFALFTFVLVKFARFSRWALGVFLIAALVMGARYVLAAWVPEPYSLFGAAAVILSMRFVHRVIMHDVAIVLGIAGVSTLLGLSITPLIAVVLLSLLSLYDIYSVYRSKHMVALAGRMLESGTVFGILVPARPVVFFHDVRRALSERSVMMLGSGDIGLPIVLAASSVTSSLGAAVVSSVGAVLGMVLMQALWMRQERPAPMAALPPIAAGAILGYLIATLSGI